MQIKIRTASLKDIEKYTGLLQQSYQNNYVKEDVGLIKDCFSKEIFNNIATQEYLKSNLIKTPEQKTWLVFDEAELIGSITCSLKNEREAEFKGFYVQEKYQGQKLGQTIYNKAAEFAGNRDLLLDVFIYNIKAIKIYKKWGWKLDESRGDKGYFTRHWPEWPKELEMECLYLRLKRKV